MRVRVLFGISLLCVWVMCACMPEDKGPEQVTCVASDRQVYLEERRKVLVPWDSFPADDELVRVVFEPELGRHVVAAKQQSGNNLVLYDLEHNRKLYEVEVPEEGPLAVGAYTDFWFHRRDSVYFIDPHAYKLYLKTPIRVESFDLPVSRPDNYYWPVPSVNCRIYLDMRRHWLIAPMFETWETRKEESLFAHPWLAVVDLESGRLLRRLGEWPDRRPVGFYECPSMVLHGDTLVAAFGLEHAMRVYDVQSGQMPGVVCGQGLDRLAPPRPSQEFGSFEATFRYFVENSFYLSLYYDPWRKLYYRTYKKPKAWRDAAGKRTETYYDEWHIQILDAQFRLAGTATIPRVYAGLASFLVLPSGIWLKKSDDYRESEDLLEWQEFVVYEK